MRYDDQLPVLGAKIDKPRISENMVVNACIKWLWHHGCFVWRQNTGAYKPEGSSRFIRFGKKGCADIIGLNGMGVFLAVECKAGKNKQQPAQVIFQKYIQDKNGIYIVAYSTDDLEARKREIVG